MPLEPGTQRPEQVMQPGPEKPPGPEMPPEPGTQRPEQVMQPGPEKQPEPETQHPQQPEPLQRFPPRISPSNGTTAAFTGAHR